MSNFLTSDGYVQATKIAREALSDAKAAALVRTECFHAECPQPDYCRQEGACLLVRPPEPVPEAGQAPPIGS